MSRLPTPGGDEGNWGDVLNDYLSQSHNSDGSLRTDSVTASQLATGSVKTATIADGAITTSKLAAGSVMGAQLDDAIKASLAKADTSLQSADLATVATTGAYTDLTGAPTLGTASALDVGATTGTVAAGDDSRLSDARTPTVHASTHGTGQADEITPAAIGAQPAGSYAAASHTHAIGDIDATGTPDATTYLRGDGTWSMPSSGGGAQAHTATVTVPTGWTTSTTITVTGMVGPCMVSPADAASQTAWAAGGWWISSATDGEITVTGTASTSSADVIVMWWGV